MNSTKPSVVRIDGTYPSFAWNRVCHITRRQAANLIEVAPESMNRYLNKAYTVCAEQASVDESCFKKWWDKRIACRADTGCEPPHSTIAVYNYDECFWIIKYKPD
jgi:hypothetical protein